jgi:hypothetical protein
MVLDPIMNNRSEETHTCEREGQIRSSLELLIERDNPMADAAEKTLEML